MFLLCGLLEPGRGGAETGRVKGGLLSGSGQCKVRPPSGGLIWCDATDGALSTVNQAHKHNQVK